MVIPQYYSRDLALGKLPQVLIAANAVNGTKGSIGSAYLSQIVSAHTMPSTASIMSATNTLYLYNKHLNFKLFMIPALFAIIMMLMTGYLPALNIVSEKEAGTIEQINVTPVNKWVFILAKLIPYWAIAMFVVTICLLLAWVVYGITPVGNIALIYLLSLFVVAFLFVFRTNNIQLFRQYAAIYAHNVVLRGYTHTAFGALHPISLYAISSLYHHIYKSCKVLY